MNRIPALLTLALAAGTASTALAAPSYADAQSGSVAAKQATSVSITVKNPEPEVGDVVKIKGAVTARAGRNKVTLQVKYADATQWKNLTSTRLTAAGTYTFSDKVKTVRERKYRVLASRAGGRADVMSSKAKVTVFGWRALTSLTPVNGGGMFEVGSVPMNGVSYPDAILGQAVVTTTATIDYNLNRDCKAFEGQVGLSDNSPAGGSAAVSISADGTQRYAGTFALTQSAPVALDLTKVFRVTVATTPTNGGLGAVGAAQVLCSF